MPFDCSQICCDHLQRFFKCGFILHNASHAQIQLGFIHKKYSRLHYDFLLLKDCSFTFQRTLTNLIYRAFPHATSPSSNCTFKMMEYLLTMSALTRFKHHIISCVSRAQMNSFHVDIEKEKLHT